MHLYKLTLMPDTANRFNTPGRDPQSKKLLSEPCIMVIFGASGDLTKRLLMPAVYNLACDGLLAENFAILGTGRSEMSEEEFRDSMTGEDDGLRAFHTRKEFDVISAGS